MSDKIDQEEINGEEMIEDSAAINNSKQKWILAIAGCILIGLVSIAGIYLVMRSSPGGNPVAAPRDSSFSSDKAEIPKGTRVVSISEDQLKSAGLRFVTAGETLTPTTSDATTTGVVKANEYEETPAVSQVSGVVSSINTELGSYVRRGETIAVVSSENYAQAQSDYLKEAAELDESRKRYRRALELSEISNESRTDLDKALAMFKTANAEEVEARSDRVRSVKLEKIGAISKNELERAIEIHEKALATQEEAKKRLDRAQRLLKINPARKNEIDAFLTRVRKLEAAVGAKRERLLVLGMSKRALAGLKSARDITSRLPITAPVSGNVTERFINGGEVVSKNSKIVAVTDLSTVWVIAQVYEKDIGGLRVGTGVGISSATFPGEYFRGNVAYVDPELDEKTRTAQARIVLANPGQKFKVGMYVNVSLSSSGNREKTAPVVPKTAVQRIGESSFVFKKTEDPKKFIMQEVVTFPENNDLVPIKSGIFVGDEIVSEGSFLLRAEWLKTNPS